MKKITIAENDRIFIRDGGKGNIGCGSINDDGHLYCIDEKNRVAWQLSEKYESTPMYLYPAVGGYQDGMIMVSLLGELDLQYYHKFQGAAGMWGWIDIEGKEVIPPQFIYALQFFCGQAIVCRGEWEIDEQDRYWCRNEQWGVINTKGEEILPCRFDELYMIDDTIRYVFCHEGGWESGLDCIYDIETKQKVTDLDFSFDMGYMFNECWMDEDHIIFSEHIPGEEIDYLYAYSLSRREWDVYHKKVGGREFNGETKIVVNKDGKDIIVF